ncbi:DUF1467 family protein [Rhizobium sp. L1K21]|uniref:DUF1467 family protein n=1 Tax=Rhizobium sp. L1K21 TaxID=2954933 RepID=UPI0020937C9E|nr:DUF1467 family protein [Rhizobium sp. L1K21]MCO6186088.1 DUF1467 family protein [Rhizobium sp. L1K21]
MNLFFHVAVYFIVWWFALFLILPTGVFSQHDAGEVTQGTVASAPAKYRATRTILLTTALAAVLYGGWLVLSYYFGISFDTILDLFPDPPAKFY